ncbi:pimeloyl-ACP methyl ester esterase BioH [Glaciecola siphonariae]|uniref:Pimeloyl-[acyl-carrier protein] methyl ester esterase n=1 Tax=Glaciecola siphonariae TaxID=521012 RepID=A0ABV9LQQ2_9ALTE
MQIRQLNKSTELQICLLHGWGMNAAIFEQFSHLLELAVNRELQQTVDIHLIDLPGYGNEIGQYAHGDIASLSAAVERRLPDDCVVLGWSLGGLVAQALAVNACKKISALITVCSSPKFVASDDWPGIDAKVLANFQEQLVHSSVKTLKRFLAIQNLGQPDAKTNIQRMLNAVNAKPIANADTLKGGLNILHNTDLREHLHLIKVPTLRLYGRLDSLVPHKAQQKITALHPTCKSIVYSKASHAPSMSHPQDMIDDIVSFIKSVKKY